MKITKKKLEKIIVEETKKVLEQAGVIDIKNKESRPKLSNDEMRSLSMKELEKEWLSFGCKSVAMTSSDGAIEYCEKLNSFHVKRAKAKNISVDSLYHMHSGD
tara:strand:- start:498 stop:806 length:309 start_codon:yes stop_codon:yes gene_type:complete